jgi:hypothetical protein
MEPLRAGNVFRRRKQSGRLKMNSGNNVALNSNPQTSPADDVEHINRMSLCFRKGRVAPQFKEER